MGSIRTSSSTASTPTRRTRTGRTTRTALTALTAVVLATGATLLTTTAASADLAKPTSTSARHVDRSSASAALLTGIRVAKHDTFDRVVFDLRGGAPGYDVRYVTRPYYDPSGKPVSMPGSAYLQVALNPASAWTTSGQHTYSGPGRATMSYPTMRGFVLTGDFEAVLSVALGLSKKAAFRVITLTNPTRIVIDVAH